MHPLQQPPPVLQEPRAQCEGQKDRPRQAEVKALRDTAGIAALITP